MDTIIVQVHLIFSLISLQCFKQLFGMDYKRWIKNKFGPMEQNLIINIM